MSGQTEFRHALLDPARPVPANLRDGHGGTAGRRFAVYRNNVAVSLGEALQTGFPTVAKLIGDENFKAIAARFLRAHPPKSPLMMRYGDAFPDFLSGIDALAHLGYLPDIARLDLAIRQSYHAADATPLTTEALASIAPGDMADLRLTLAPALRVVPSRWPIHAIWRFNHEDGPQPTAQAEDVVITRPDYDPLPRLLPPGGAAILSQLGAGATLGMAVEAAADSATPDLPALLSLLVADKCLIDTEIAR